MERKGYKGVHITRILYNLLFYNQAKYLITVDSMNHTEHNYYSGDIVHGQDNMFV